MKKSGLIKLITSVAVVGLIMGLAYWSFGDMKNAQGLERNTLAVVNNSKITKGDFDNEWQRIPKDMQEQFKADREGFLENIILYEVLYQEAKLQGIASSGKDAKERAVQELVHKVSSNVSVTDEEIRKFYDTNPEQMKGAKFEDIRDDIKQYILVQKQDEAVEAFIDNLRSKATIILNEDWLKEQRRTKSDNPFTKVVKNGRPTVLDLGSNTCIPCKMMKPILDELEQEYKGKANILVIEIGEYRELARQYRVRVIPTQIFFDKNGNEAWRHEGFLAKEDIQAKLRELGVE